MERLVIATTATETPMGAQHYQESIASRAERALAQESAVEWSVRRTVARSLRSPLGGNVRLPMGRLRRAGTKERALLGRLVYPANAIVHRMDLTLPPPPGPEVVTLHDVVAWTFPDEEKPAIAAAAELNRADAVVCVSEFTAQEAQRVLGLKDAVVIPNGVDEQLFVAEALGEEELRMLGIDGAFVLYAGGSAARKNLAGLADAWRLLQRGDTQLVLVGPRSSTRDQLFTELRNVVHTGRVEEATLNGLMAAATAIVVPSLYEGFGLPALEAMAVGTPLLCADTSSLPEVVGDGGLLCQPTARSLAEGLEALLDGGVDTESMVVRGKERAAHLTWDVSAQRHAKLWDSVR